MTDTKASRPRRFARRCALAALLGVAITPHASPAAVAVPTHASHKKHVLLLNSYDPTYRWAANIVAGARSIFDPMTDVELSIEYMDSKKTFTPEYARLLSQIYALRYGNLRFDLIVSADDDALDFLKTYRDQLFPGVPVVFCGVNGFQDQRISDFANVTGVNESADFDKSIEWVARLRPDTKTLVFIFDRSATSTGSIVHLAAIRPRWSARFDIRVITDVTVNQLEATLRRLPQDAVVFWGMFMRDKAGTPLSMGESHQIVVGASPVPVFGFTDVSVSYGAVGGYVVSGMAQGETAARMGVRILGGTRAADVPIVRESPNVYMFDYPAFKRWNLSIDNLPPGTIVVDKPFSFYERYRRTVWAALGGMGTETLVILALIAAIRTMTRKTRARLRESEDRYRSIVEDGSELICRFDQFGKVVFVNGAVARLVGQAAATIVGGSVWSLFGASPSDAERHGVESLTRARPLIAVEQAVVTGAGERRWILWTYRGLFTPAGRLVGVQAVGHDLTDRRQAQLALEAALHEVEVGNLELGDANQNLQGVLDSMREGLVVCDRQGLLTKVHSRAAAEWFGAPQQGIGLWDYLFPAGSPEQTWFRTALEQVGEEILPFDVAVAQLPQVVKRGDSTYSLACHAVMRDGQFAALVFTLADVTHQLEQDHIQQRHRELPLIVKHLLHDRDGFQGFVDETEQMLARLNLASDVGERRRLLHTIKGTAGIYGFELFAARCHALEDALEIDAGDHTTGTSFAFGVEALTREWSTTLASFSMFLSDQAQASIRLERGEHEDFLSRLESGEDHAQLLRLARRWSHPPISQVVGIYARTIRQLAIRLGKEVEPQIIDHQVRLPSAEMRSFLGVLVHVVRNSVDHGIEDPDERVRAGKARVGRVSIESRLEGPELVIAVEDDGRGIDWESIRRRAPARGMAAVSESDLIEAMFVDGVSTREAISQISGRGVGLSAVREVCRQLGGTIQVDSRAGQGTRFEFRFVLSPALPATTTGATLSASTS